MPRKFSVIDILIPNAPKAVKQVADVVFKQEDAEKIEKIASEIIQTKLNGGEISQAKSASSFL